MLPYLLKTMTHSIFRSPVKQLALEQTNFLSYNFSSHFVVQNYLELFNLIKKYALGNISITKTG